MIADCWRTRLILACSFPKTSLLTSSKRILMWTWRALWARPRKEQKRKCRSSEQLLCHSNCIRDRIVLVYPYLLKIQYYGLNEHLTALWSVNRAMPTQYLWSKCWSALPCLSGLPRTNNTSSFKQLASTKLLNGSNIRHSSWHLQLSSMARH